jgi:beta-phosphoglucomutase-like phosphatase (HAD superfamily)/dTDP-glucose pyrophosphorylase
MLAIFDLDGVLVDSKQIHFEALNDALSVFGTSYQITLKEHSTKYDGLSTMQKLEKLNKDKNLPIEIFDKIWSLKQENTSKMLEGLTHDNELIGYFQQLVNKKINLAVASNSIRRTIELVLQNLGIIHFFPLILSNEDIKSPKPHPEIYWKAMAHYGELPSSTFIFEDSHIGRLAAQRSGAILIPIDNRKDLTLEKISTVYSSDLTFKQKSISWKSDNLNVLIPMAGFGSRFATAGFTFPKPLIEVLGKPMIQVVVENLNIDANYIYIVQKNHFEKYNLEYLLRLITPRCSIIQIDSVTEGAACTTLLAKKFIDNESSLLIANSDQFIEWDSGEALYSFAADSIDGGIITFTATHPKWSFVKLNEDGNVSEVAEKKSISTIATAGIYYWKRGSDYVKYAEQMIAKNIRTNNEFYVCPVFNEAIIDKKIVRIRHIEKMWGLGTPEDLNDFLKNNS